MAKISGVPIELITKIAGVQKALVRKLGNKLTAELGFGPDYNPGPTCETWSMSYSSVSLADAVNNGTGINVEIGDNDIWYAEGSCGNFIAETGYYFLDDYLGEVFYFYWDAETEELSQLEAPVFGPTCDTVTSFYSAVSLWDAYDAGIETTIELPEDGDKFYKESDCGGDFATTGYYVIIVGKRNIFYYFWDASAQTLTGLEAPQPPAAGPTNTSSPNLFANITAPLLWNSYGYASRGEWTGTGNITYMYEWYADNVLISTNGPYPYTDSKGGVVDPQPSLPAGASLMFQTVELRVIATDDNGSTTSTTSTQVEDSDLNTFLTNTGITDSTRIEALKYLQKELIVNNWIYKYNSNGPILDYYPFAGADEFQNKWSLYSPNDYFNFSGNWTHSSNGSQTNGSTATSTKLYNKPGNNYGFSIGIYNSNPVTEDSIDVSLTKSAYSYTAGIQRQVGGARKAYFTRPPAVVNTDVDMVSSVGWFSLQHFASITMNGSYDNGFEVALGDSYNVINAGFGNFGNTADTNFVIGGNGSTKNFQFAATGYTSLRGLHTVLQTYNSMLGR